MNKLYCINQNDNMNNLLAIKYFNPEQVILIETDEDNNDTLDQFSNYLKDFLGLGIRFIHTHNKPFYFSKEKATDSSIFILPSDNSVIGYQLLLNLIRENIDLAYVEDDGDIFLLKGDQFMMETDSTNIEIEDYIHSRGGVITSDTTDLFSHGRIIKLLDFLEGNLGPYNTLFRHTSKRKSFYKSYPDNRNKLILYPYNLNKKNRLFMNELLDFMAKEDIIRINQRLKDQVIISFKHKSYKSYLLKTGTWLEHRLFLLFREAGMDDVEASLSFLWDKDRRAGNEIDVLGIKNNNLIVASCKDRNHIDPSYINEIYTNAKHLGNGKSLRILFTTADISFGVQEKADEFNVHIIKYKRRPKDTLNELLSIIDKL